MAELISYEEFRKNPSNFYLIDVRSEKEFEDDHNLNSVNMPVLDNDQRHIVGYVYKQIDPK